MIAAWIGCVLAAPVEGVVAWDAQPAPAVTLAGFAPLGPLDLPDGAARWSSPPSRGLSGDWPDPLSADGWVGGALSLSLAPGPWILWVLVPTTATVSVGGQELPGVEATLWPDQLAASDPFPVFKPGESEWERRVTRRAGWRRVRVEAGESGVPLSVTDGALHALVAAPFDDRAAGGARVRAADAARRAAWVARWGEPVANPRIEHGPLALSTTTAVGVPWEQRSPVGAEVRLSAAPGEWVQQTFWLEGGDASGTVSVSGVDGAEIYELHWLDAAGPWPRERRPRPAFARPVLMDGASGGLRGGQGTPVGFVLRFPAPERGDRAVVEVTRGAEVARVEIALDVLRVRLPEARLKSGFFLAPPARWTASPPPEAVGWIHAQHAAMRQFGASAVAWRGLTAASSESDTLARAALCDWGATGPFHWWDMAALRPTAFPDDADGTWSSGDTARYQARDALGTACRADVVHFLYNEEGHKSLRAVDQGAAAGARVSEAGGRTSGAFAGRVDWPAAAGLDVVMVHGRPLLDLADRDALKQIGAEDVWSYNLPAGRSGPWLAWASGTSGLLQWQWTPDDGDPYDLVGPVERWSYSFPAPDGAVWPSVALLEWTEGVADLRWIAWAESRAKRKDRAGRALAQLLADVRAGFDGAWVVGRWDHEGAPAAALAAMRERIQAVARGSGSPR